MTLLPLAHREAHKLQVPMHVSWSFNGVDFAPIDQTVPFSFTYNVDWNMSTPDLKTAVQNALVYLQTTSGKVLSICLSGSDSEIIAREAHALGLPFELYFLNIWDNNYIERHDAELVAAALGKTLNVITLDKTEAWNNVLPAQFQKLMAGKPTYLVLPYLLDRIPPDTFIIGGEGDPAKESPEYSFSETQLPIATTEVFYRQWALENNRLCDMYFFSSTPELLVAYVKHPLIQRTANVISTDVVKETIWPNLIYTQKTNNWLNVPGSNQEVKAYLTGLISPASLVPQTVVNLDVL